MATPQPETDLARMLATLTVSRRPGEFVFVSVGPGTPLPANAEAMIREDEGITLVLERSVADAAGYAYDYVGAWLTLDVFSALEAVGLTAAFSATLGKVEIPANVIAGFHHDHIVVPADRADAAIRCLEKMNTDNVTECHRS